MDISRDLPPAARAGTGAIDGACWRPGDSVKHLGPPARLQISYWSRLFQTRCGLTVSDGDWQACGCFPWANDDDYWCPACLTQAGLPFELYDDARETS